MPPRKPKVSPFALEIVQRLKDRLRDADRLDHLTLSHRIPVISPVDGARLMFTVEVTPGHEGSFLATCRELPGLFASGDDEPSALIMAELQIRHRLRKCG